MDSATQMLARYNLEGERPTQFFCYMKKKHKKIAKFYNLIHTVVDEHGNEEEETLHKQCDIEEEVLKYYETLYKQLDFKHTQNEISDRIGNDIKKISEHEKLTLEEPIGMTKMNHALRNTRNYVRPGVSGFSGAFYKVFCARCNA